MKIDLCAWTGGSRPLLKPLHRTMVAGMQKMISELFREQVIAWVVYWNVSLPLSIARIFWRRAVYDVYASYREAARKGE